MTERSGIVQDVDWRRYHWSRLVILLTLVLGAVYVDPSSASAGSIASVRKGRWSSPATWNLGRVPQPGDTVIVRHALRLNRNASVAGIDIRRSGRLSFTPRKSRRLTSSGNVVVNGLLRMRPANASVNHTLRFTGAVESEFVGGGMEVLPTDDGLWVMGSGRLDISGTPKRGWCSGCSNHDTWQTGDELRVTPTALNDFSTFAPFTPGSRVPSVAGRSAEILNLTRNVVIEGLPTGRAHIFIRSTSPQMIRYATVQHMGPRSAPCSGAALTRLCFVPGRYGIHFHHSMDGSRGSIVEGVVVRDTGSHAFVPHSSHGITLRDTIAYDVMEDPYWWDFPGKCAGGGPCGPTDENCSHDIVIDRAVAALVHPGDNPFRMAGFALQCGLRNSVTNSVAVGVLGDVDTSGFGWLEGVVESAWKFRDNVAHNNRRNGIFWWQIDCVKHVVNRFDSYRNGGNGIEHGAYVNNVVYRNVSSYQDGGNDRDAALWLVAGNRLCPPDLIFRNFTIDGGDYSTNAVLIDRKIGQHTEVTVMRDFNIMGYGPRPIVISEHFTEPNDDHFDIDMSCFSIDSRDIKASDIRVDAMDPLSVLRVQQRDDTAFRLTSDGVTPIPSFTTCT